MTNRIAAALPVRDIPRTRNVEPVPIEPRTAEQDSAGVLRVGIVGIGEQTATHLLPALLTMPEVRITALVDPLRERRDALANRIGVASGFDSVAQLLTDGEVDAVVAACPPQAHEQIAAAAIAARVPVFVEKPPATTTTALTELAAAAAESGAVTGVGMNFRWAAPVRRIRALLDGGAYGHPTVITVRHAMTALPVLAVGAIPVFADVAHPATFALDLDDVANKRTPRTKAVIAVPMWGYPADGPELARACRDWGVPLVEDAAQAHGTSLSGRYAGTQGIIGAFSTHARKLICTGEGGFCLTGDPALADRLRQLRNLGQPPGGGEFGARFGLNYKLPALAAALGRVQLSRLTSRLAQRRLILGELTTMASEIVGLEPFPIPHGATPNGYAALFTAETNLASSIAHRSRAAGIESDVLRYDYRPLYRIPVLTRYAPTQPCRNAERLAATLLTVPCHERVATDELARIGAAWRG